MAQAPVNSEYSALIQSKRFAACQSSLAAVAVIAVLMLKEEDMCALPLYRQRINRFALLTNPRIRPIKASLKTLHPRSRPNIHLVQ